MPKKGLDVNWERKARTEDFKPALKRYCRHLEDAGLRESTLASCSSMPLGIFNVLGSLAETSGGSSGHPP
jgi:hypothetical protein